MKVVKTNIENLEASPLMLYKLTRSKNAKLVSKLDDDELDKIYHVDCFAKYEDVNNKGETVELLSIMSGETVLTAQSATFKHSFDDILSLVSDRGFSIQIVCGESKSGRRYMDCELYDVD